MGDKIENVCNVDCSTDSISPKWVLKLKSTIRPFITYSWHILSIWAVVMYFIGKIHLVDKDIVEHVLYIETVIIIFWFGERLARNIGVTDFLKNFNNSKGDKNEQKNL